MKSLLLFAALLIGAPVLAGNPIDIDGEYDVETPERIEAARREIEAEGFVNPERAFGFAEGAKDDVLARYPHLDPKREIATALLEKAILYFDANKKRFQNAEYVTVVDFTLRSDKVRLFVIDMKTGAVDSYHTTHGLYSDRDNDGYAESFGNVPNSGKSSLGPARTAEIYQGKFKRSLRLDGLAPTNSNLRARAVVMHGWDKVHEANVKQGLSWGCITLDWKVRDDVLDKVKGGSLVYAGVTAAPPARSQNVTKRSRVSKKHRRR